MRMSSRSHTEEYCFECKRLLLFSSLSYSFTPLPHGHSAEELYQARIACTLMWAPCGLVA
ncbi:hypothetical protein HMPREF3185_01594 [Porphyromonas somerae]|uniref:Uncharacterized protein n=1 Tax=Porphyromonas somerae TaxID=322095 RepID=A0A134B4L8_9PORP|nr:hypothetical protein HMPREF3184_01594 [Porphyromonadaceae bacterium KA00676]KXB74881.1 hypothetical protein HMPREF3185_01594 [Porphyromonas somerae]